jgi:hypothetical protein
MNFTQQIPLQKKFQEYKNTISRIKKTVLLHFPVHVQDDCCLQKEFGHAMGADAASPFIHLLFTELSHGYPYSFTETIQPCKTERRTVS